MDVKSYFRTVKSSSVSQKNSSNKKSSDTHHANERLKKLRPQTTNPTVSTSNYTSSKRLRPKSVSRNSLWAYGFSSSTIAPTEPVATACTQTTLKWNKSSENLTNISSSIYTCTQASHSKTTHDQTVQNQNSAITRENFQAVLTQLQLCCNAIEEVSVLADVETNKEHVYFPQDAPFDIDYMSDSSLDAD